MVPNKLSSVNEAALVTLEHYGPVTALKIHKNLIFAGYGCFLKIFDANENYRLIYSAQAFARNKIHSIAVCNQGTQLLLTGGRSFAVINLINLGESTIIHEKAIDEWIVSGIFVDQGMVLILTAHNIIYKIDINKFDIVEKIHCQEKSILYSGSIRITLKGKIYVCAGTVMNGILIWDLESRTILHHLTEHEGSIFGVKIDANAQYIISCSDDRSIILYDFQSGAVLSRGWGHGSRIWNLEFFKQNSENLRIFSTGEDCTARIWEYDPTQSELIALDVVECHLGKHVWSGDIDDEFLQVFVTGGADGRIILNDISPRTPLETYSLTDISSATGCTFAKKELIKQYVELPQLDILVVLTSQGQLFTLNQQSKIWVQLQIPDMNKFADFGLMEFFEITNTLILSCRNGDLLVLNFEDASNYSHYWILDQYFHNNKVSNLLVSPGNDDKVYVLIDCPNPKMPLVLRIFEKDKLIDTKFLEQPHQSSFTTTCMTFDPLNNLLIIGSRFVSIAFYDIGREVNGLIPMVNFYKKLSVGDTITSISILEALPAQVKFLVTVRDGVYMIINYTLDSSLNILHKNKIARGFVEGGYFQGKNLILYGFKSSYFYLWDETNHREIINELCGGAHRQWKFIKYASRSRFNYKFLYINKSILYIKNYKVKFNNPIIHDGTHGREIRDVAISPEFNGNSRFILTASEDTKVKLSKLKPNGQITNLWSMNAHVSGLQTVKFLNSQYAASSAANEEFIIWKIDDEKMTDIAHLKPSATINPDLRIMDFDSYPLFVNNKLSGFRFVVVYSDSNIKTFDYCLETNFFKLINSARYSTCCLLNVQYFNFNERKLIMIGSTDGFLTFWDDKDLKPVLGAQIHQSGIKAVLILQETTDYISIVTGGDDNMIMLHKLTVIDDKIAIKTVLSNENASSATITSLNKIGENNFIATSVDQIVRKWDGTNLECLAAKYTTIADTGSSATTTFNGKHMVLIGGAGLSSWEVN